ILELNFQAKPPGTKAPILTEFGSRVEGTDQVGVDRFTIMYESVLGFEVDRTQIAIGELSETSSPQTYELLVFSSTRDKMPALTVRVLMPTGVAGEPGGFISTGSPVAAPEEELERLAESIAMKAGRPGRVRSAFRVPVTVKVKDGDRRLDIGQVERVIWITEGADTKQVSV